MQDFVQIINEIHNSVKKGSRTTLPVEEITQDFLIEKGIIKKEGEHIVFLDTEQIGENYLMLWNERLILSLKNLQHLVLSNLELN